MKKSFLGVCMAKCGSGKKNIKEEKMEEKMWKNDMPQMKKTQTMKKSKKK
jgi:hypothetical protein